MEGKSSQMRMTMRTQLMEVLQRGIALEGGVGEGEESGGGGGRGVIWMTITT